MLSQNTKNDYDVCIGVITAVDGVRGYVKIRSFTESPQDIISFGRVFDENGREYNIKIMTLKKGYVIANIDGVDSRDEAEKLRNTRLYIKRSQLPAALGDEFYHADLVGLDALMSNGARCGIVKGVLNFGAGDILEIYDITSEKTICYPFTKQFVPKIDIANRCVMLEPLEEVVAASD